MLKAIAPTIPADKMDNYALQISLWAEWGGLTTEKRMAHFLAQVAYESGGFVYTKEIASGKKYEGRKDLGNTQPGDGIRFKGRGLIQLTGRANYQAYANSTICKGDLMANPALLERLPGCVKSAVWYWKTRGLNALADADNVEEVTRRINGGKNGLPGRKRYLTRAKAVLADEAKRQMEKLKEEKK